MERRVAIAVMAGQGGHVWARLPDLSRVLFARKNYVVKCSQTHFKSHICGKFSARARAYVPYARVFCSVCAWAAILMHLQCMYMFAHKNNYGRLTILGCLLLVRSHAPHIALWIQKISSLCKVEVNMTQVFFCC